MNKFSPKEFENLHTWKIKNGLNLDEISSQYFFCIDNRMMFIKKSRKHYKLMASCQCGFQPLYRESCLDVLYGSTCLNDVIIMFYKYVNKLVEVCSELY